MKDYPSLRAHYQAEEIVIAKDQIDYMPLPSLISNTPYRVVTSRYRLSLKERLRILFHGNLYSQIMTFGNPLQPIKITTEEPKPEECL